MTKINNAKALDLIRNSSGRFISITGIKKNGEIREYKSSIYNQDMYNNLNVGHLIKGLSYDSNNKEK